MVSYRCYVLDAEEHILQAHDLDCEGDDQVETLAQDLLSQDPYHRSVEVWRATRRIVKVERDASLNIRLTRRSQRANRLLGSPI